VLGEDVGNPAGIGQNVSCFLKHHDQLKHGRQNMKFASILIVSTLLAGCGTINTVFRDDMVASNKLARWHSHCDSIPRIYSGAALNFCTLDAEPRNAVGFDGHPAPSLILFDLALSGVADTVVLPYSIYLQSKRGDIPKARFE
jgi:uncharacterized protein YceK